MAQIRSKLIVKSNSKIYLLSMQNFSDSVTHTEEILFGKFLILCSVWEVFDHQA